VLEAILSVGKVLVDIERAGGTISGAKSEFLSLWKCQELHTTKWTAELGGGVPTAKNHKLAPPRHRPPSWEQCGVNAS